MAAMKVSHEQFVETWMKSKSHQEVADSTGMSYCGVLGRRQLLKKSGVILPKINGGLGRKSIDAAALNKMIADLSAK